MRPCALALLVLVGCGDDRLILTEDVLLLSPASLDFKDVPVGLSVLLRVNVENPGAREVTVTGVSIDSSAFSAPFEPFTVPAGDTISATFAFSPSTLGVHTASAIVKSSAKPVTIALRGVGAPVVVCGSCSSIPPSMCASAQTLITYQPATGACLEGSCEYKASSQQCAYACDASERKCIAAPVIDAGTVPKIDAGPPPSAADAGPLDAGPVDAGQVDTGPHGYIEWFDGGEYSWVPPAGVTKAVFHGCGGGGAGGSVEGATGGGAACGEADFYVVAGRAVRARVGLGGQQPGNGGGYTGLFFSNSSNLEDFVLGGGGGGGNGCAGCAGHFGGKGGAGGAEKGKDGEVYFGSGTICSTARGGLGGRETGGIIFGAGGLGGEVPGGTGAVRCPGGFGSRLSGGASKTANTTGCAVSGGPFLWREGGSEPGTGGAGGAGYYGGGGGGFVKDLCGGGGGGGSSWMTGTNTAIFEGDGQTPGLVSIGRRGAGRGGDAAVGGASSIKGADGYILITW